VVLREWLEEAETLRDREADMDSREQQHCGVVSLKRPDDMIDGSGERENHSQQFGPALSGKVFEIDNLQCQRRGEGG